jgi:hypothetical protein
VGAITSQVKGIDTIRRQLDGFRGDLERCIESAVDQLEELAYLMVDAQYASDGRAGPTGRQWTRKPSTIAAYTRENRAGFRNLNQNMRRTDALHISETRKGAPHQIREVTPISIKLGTDLLYGAIQQERGQKQYDPPEKVIKQAGIIIVRGQKGKALAQHFQYQEGAGGIPF